MLKNIILGGIAILSVAVIFCAIPTQKASASCPSNTTVTGNQAVLVGNVTDTGGDPNLIVWFDYGTSANALTTPTTQQTFYGTGYFCTAVTSLSSCQTYYYQAYAKNSVGTSSGTVNSFTTTCLPVTVNLLANGSAGPVNVGYGSNVTLSWTTSNAATCSASGDWSGSEPTAGNTVLTLSTVKTYTFTLTCKDSTQTQTGTDSVTVNVTANPPVVITLPAVVTQ